MKFRKLGAIAAATLTFGAGGTMVADKKINPYNDKGTHYELALKSDIPQGERVEIAKDRATMTLKGWNDEYAITIEPQIPSITFGAAEKIDRPFTVAANRPLLSKKMEYQSGDVTAFIEPKEGTENEFDIDFTLHSKPDTNVFEYKLKGAEDFHFFYQPELTAEEIAEGALRPDNVVGSYAVYHKTKANHRVGSTNYATGKAFHIYRPKAIDANGAEVWAELSYVNGVLSVTVPQSFLDDAVYPLKVDPTFGYTTVGATPLARTSANVSRGDETTADTYTAASGDTVTLLSIYAQCTVSGSGSIGFAVYALAAGSMSGATRLTTEQTITINSTTAQWFNSSALSTSMTAGVQYTTAAGNWNKGTCTALNVFYDSFVGMGTGSTGALPATYTRVSSDSTHPSMYATYTASGGGSGGSSSTPQVIIFE